MLAIACCALFCRPPSLSGLGSLPRCRPRLTSGWVLSFLGSWRLSTLPKGLFSCWVPPSRGLVLRGWPVSHRALRLPSCQGILRSGLEEVRQFFTLNGSCRLPLSPSLLVKGIVPRVSDWWRWGSRSGEGSVEARSSLTWL